MLRNFPGHEGELANVDWDGLCAGVRKVHSSWRAKLFKSYAGGWTTTTRMHESPTYTCIFGCANEADDWRHYVFCTPLWSIVSQACESQPADSPWAQIAIDSEFDRDNFLPLVVAFDVYHDTKNRYRSKFLVTPFNVDAEWRRSLVGAASAARRSAEVYA